MKARLVFATAAFFCAFFLAACKSGEGPLLINVSGETVHLRVFSENGSSHEGTCENQSAVWVGKSGVSTVRVEIGMAAARHVLEGDALRVRFGKDRSTAFVIESAGPRKLTVREAEILMRNRAR